MIDMRKINEIKQLCIYCNEYNVSAKVTKDINALIKKLYAKIREDDKKRSEK